MKKLTPEMIDNIRKKVIQHIDENLNAIDSTCEKLPFEDSLSVSLSVKIINKGEMLVVETGISFATGKIKEKEAQAFHVKQMPLPLD